MTTVHTTTLTRTYPPDEQAPSDAEAQLQIELAAKLSSTGWVTLHTMSSRTVLSDGTVQILARATLEYDS